MYTRPRHAFTLVELLVVLAIIGILVSILIPTIAAVRKRAQNARINFEVNKIQQSVEAYKLKYNDYPPNPGNTVLLERHLRAAFPEIVKEEAQVLARYADSIDPAEAIVFWLGGLSADPKRPFTGEGGPLKMLRDSSGTPVNGSSGNPVYVANGDRNDPLFDFQEPRLTQRFGLCKPLDSDSEYEVLHSVDEQLFFGAADADQKDPFPAYLPPSLKTPYVYFEARSFAAGPEYEPTAMDAGEARPYRSDTVKGTNSSGQKVYKWAHDGKFQVIAAGLDNHYGVGNLNKRFPSGENYSSYDLDNLCNFADGKTLGDSLP